MPCRWVLPIPVHTIGDRCQEWWSQAQSIVLSNKCLSLYMLRSNRITITNFPWVPCCSHVKLCVVFVCLCRRQPKRWGLLPVTKGGHRIGLVLDCAIEDDLRLRHVQVSYICCMVWYIRYGSPAKNTGVEQRSSRSTQQYNSGRPQVLLCIMPIPMPHSGHLGSIDEA